MKTTEEKIFEDQLRDPEVIWYGPHSCNGCGTTILKRGKEFGPELSLEAPQASAYPNHDWKEHKCPNRLPVQILSAGTILKFHGLPVVLHESTKFVTHLDLQKVAAHYDSVAPQCAGGKARAKSLSSKRRKEIATKAAKKRWSKPLGR